MKNSLYKGVAVVVTNKQRSLFYMQQKDETYWVPQFRLKYCFFGGKINLDESEKEALERELFEELEANAVEKICDNLKKLFDDYFENIMRQKCKFSLYESVLTNRELKYISQLPIKEGKRGVLIKREEIFNIPIMSDLKGTLRNYINKL